jgi:cytochrome c oxidase subunit II
MDYITRLLLPPQESTFAHEVDALFHFINIVSLILLVGITVAIIYFAIKYRRKTEEDTTPLITHNNPLEIIWTVIPLILILIVFGWGFSSFNTLRAIPDDAYVVSVRAYSFNWEFTYPNGVRSTNDLYVPANRPIKLVMISSDVIHSLFVPDFRIKQDVVPNRYTQQWFQTKGPGQHIIFCTEYCGMGHSDMLGMVYALEEEEFEAWLEEEAARDIDAMPLVEVGELVWRAQGCQGCHSIDGATGIGPTFQGLWMNQRQFTDGTSAVADANYIRESILEPGAKVNVGYQNIMPSYSGILGEREIEGVIEFIKELSE